MSAVIVENKMWAICFVTEAGYHVSQELLEGNSVGWLTSSEYRVLQAFTYSSVQSNSTESSVVDW